MRIPPLPPPKCEILLASGEKCGRPMGHCIHWYIPTKFGSRD